MLYEVMHPDLDSVQALPAFLAEYFPPALAGIAFATLLIAALVTASGLTLGTATTLQIDVLARFGRAGRELRRLRLVAAGVLLLALALLMGNLGSTILQWSVITSYSIHYTKLYENIRPGRRAGPVRSPGRDGAGACAGRRRCRAAPAGG